MASKSQINPEIPSAQVPSDVSWIEYAIAKVKDDYIDMHFLQCPTLYELDDEIMFSVPLKSIIRFSLADKVRLRNALVSALRLTLTTKYHGLINTEMYLRALWPCDHPARWT